MDLFDKNVGCQLTQHGNLTDPVPFGWMVCAHPLFKLIDINILGVNAIAICEKGQPENKYSLFAYFHSELLSKSDIKIDQ